MSKSHLFISFVLTFSLCFIGCSPSADTVKKEVMTSMVNEYKQKANHVEIQGIELMKISGNQYEGFANVTIFGIPNKLRVKVYIEGNVLSGYKYLWIASPN